MDKKADKSVHETANALANCYNNKFGGAERVFIAKDPVPVYWGHVSVLDADLVSLFASVCSFLILSQVLLVTFPFRSA